MNLNICSQRPIPFIPPYTQDKIEEFYINEIIDGIIKNDLENINKPYLSSLINTSVTVDRSLAIQIVLADSSTFINYLQSYFSTGEIFSPMDLNNLPSHFKTLLDKIKEILKGNQEVPQELLKQLIQIDCDEMGGLFFQATVLEGMKVSFLGLAKEFNNLEIAEFLIQNNADLYFKTDLGFHQMPIVELEQAASKSDIKFAELFYRYGVPIEHMVSSYFNNSPIELLLAAKEKNNTALISFLEKNGFHN